MSESAIEKLFREAAELLWPDSPKLVQEHPVTVANGGQHYRLDFAVPSLKKGIELDGHATHSSPEDIARDRRRKRALEDVGWQVRYYGGQEVTRDADRVVRDAISWCGLEPRAQVAHCPTCRCDDAREQKNAEVRRFLDDPVRFNQALKHVIKDREHRQVPWSASRELLEDDLLDYPDGAVRFNPGDTRVFIVQSDVSDSDVIQQAYSGKGQQHPDGRIKLALALPVLGENPAETRWLVYGSAQKALAAAMRLAGLTLPALPRRGDRVKVWCTGSISGQPGHLTFQVSFKRPASS